MSASSPRVQSGLEVLLADLPAWLAGRRVGLLTNQTGVDHRLRSGIDLLHADDRLRLVALFAPEHGVRGEAQAGVPLASAVDRRTGLPIHSLYGETRTPTAAMLDGLDALLIDLQDIGVRYATYASTVAYVLEAAADTVSVVILDRPQPLTGTRLEGNLLKPAFASFVGVHPIPIRHGMTLAELARLIAAERGLPEPAVIPMRGWRRAWWFDETGLPWVQPSPNLPTLNALTLYPGTCLIEGTNLSEGRGTTRPFEVIGAPWLNPWRLADALHGLSLPGVIVRPTFFTPAFSKHAGMSCGGVQLHITDRDALRPVELGLHLLRTLRALDPAHFAWIEGAGGHFFIDRLLGDDTPRHALDAGEPVTEITQAWPAEIDAFAVRRQPFLLYP